MEEIIIVDLSDEGIEEWWNSLSDEEKESFNQWWAEISGKDK